MMPMFPFSYHYGGLFISRGCGSHAVRRITNDEVILVVSGTLEMFEEKTKYHLKAGDFLLLRHGRRHGGLSPYPNNLRFYWHHFLPATEEGARYFDAMPSQHSIFWKESIFRLSGQILAEQQLREECQGKQQLLDAIFSGMLMDLTNAPENVPSPRNPLAEKARHFFLQHYGEPVTTADAAKSLGCCPDYLGRVFFQEYGHTIGDELRLLRIAQARRLLEIPNMTVKDAASQCGYQDLSYFHRQFFRETGMTPGNWKKKSGLGFVNTN